MYAHDHDNWGSDGLFYKGMILPQDLFTGLYQLWLAYGVYNSVAYCYHVHEFEQNP